MESTACVLCTCRMCRSESGRAAVRLSCHVILKNLPTNYPGDTLRKFPNGHEEERSKREQKLSVFSLFPISRPSLTDLTRISSERAEATIFSWVIKQILHKLYLSADERAAAKTALGVNLHLHFLKARPITIRNVNNAL